MELTARANRGRCSPDGREIQYVSVSFRAPRAESRRDRPDVNVGLVLDRSGSMNGRKLEIARRAIETSIRLLRESDRFAIVVFDNFIDTVTPSSHATAEARTTAERELGAIDARGNTDLGGGWLRGADEVEPHRLPESITRLIVATDGMANVGMVDPAEFYDQARKLKAKGITTSTIGIGADFEELLLQGMAQHGGGHAYYAEQPAQLLDILAGELGEAIEITLRDPVLEVTIPAGIGIELLDEFPVTQVPGRLEVSVGDLTSEQLVELVFEVALPPGRIGDGLALDFALRVPGAAEPLARARVEWRFATPAEVAAAPRVSEVDRRAAELIRARSQQAALERNRAGDFEQAEAEIERGAMKLEALGSDDPAVRGIAESMRESRSMYGRVLHRLASKGISYSASNQRLGRMWSGRARKSAEPEPGDSKS